MKYAQVFVEHKYPNELIRMQGESDSTDKLGGQASIDQKHDSESNSDVTNVTKTFIDIYLVMPTVNSQQLY
jgi:hypothetical protein